MNKVIGSELLIDGNRSVAAGWTEDRVEIGEKLSALGAFLVRYGLVLVILWIGAMKFTAYEANGIQPLVANSPFMGWVYQIFSVQGFSNLLGTVEI
ncbi:MAG: DUF417 family protein, partial [Candidatus Poribacteria bacterium]